MADRQSIQKYLIIAAFLQMVWGLVPSASKYVINEIPVELYVSLRWSISGLILLISILLQRSWKPLSFRNFAGVSVLGILGYGVASVATLYGLKLGGVTNFALMGALSPVITSIVAILILKERPQKLFLLALPIVVLGLFLLITGKYQISSWQVAGVSALLILGAYLLEAIIFVYSKRYKSSMSVSQYLTLSQLAAAVFMWFLQITFYRQLDQVGNLSLRGILAMLFVSVVACVLCYAVLYWLLNYIDGHRLALFDGFHTLSATVFGYFLFQEELRPMMLVGGGLILFGLIAGNWPKNLVEESPE